jgi:hypothetical protein
VESFDSKHHLPENEEPGVVHMSVIPALGRLRQEDREFKANLGNLGKGKDFIVNKTRYSYSSKATLLKYIIRRQTRTRQATCHYQQ